MNGFNGTIRTLAADATNKIANNANAHINITTTTAANTATVDNVTGLVVGQTIVGAGIPDNTTITAIDGTALTLTLSANATASATVPAVTSSTATLNLATNTSYAGQLANSADGTAILAPR